MPNETTLRVGLDIGTRYLKAVAWGNGKVYQAPPLAVEGNPVRCTLDALAELVAHTGESRFRLGITGENGKIVARAIGLDHTPDFVATRRAVEEFEPAVRTVFSLGHENLGFYRYREKGPGRGLFIEEQELNPQCAAGTGSFWLMQRTRLELNEDEMEDLAFRETDPKPIAGKCSVFARSDMTHWAQKGATQGQIVAGLAEAIVKNFYNTMVKKSELWPEILLIGGMALNRGIVKYFQRRDPVRVAAAALHFNALGAALEQPTPVEYEEVKRQLQAQTYHDWQALGNGPLRLERSVYLPEPEYYVPSRPVGVYIGVDSGSVSTKAFLLDKQGRPLGGIYFRTKGKPALQVQQLFAEVQKQYGAIIDPHDVTVCTTGSGRELTQVVIGARYEIDEIVAQALGGHYWCPEADTIFEIGGEDSKYISLDPAGGGEIIDFNMNPVCAAGTGSFLEGIAQFLDIDLQQEFAALALASQQPLDLGDRCTVFMESNVHYYRERWQASKEDLAAGLAISSVKNYKRKTVEHRFIGQQILFQGATAFNRALVAAFETWLGRPITIPWAPHLTGALGAALYIGRQEGRWESITFADLKPSRTCK